MSEVCARWAPRLLKPDQKHTRLVMSHANLAFCEADPAGFLECFRTHGECWVRHFEPETKQQSMQWKSRSSPPFWRAVHDCGLELVDHRPPYSLDLARTIFCSSTCKHTWLRSTIGQMMTACLLLLRAQSKRCNTDEEMCGPLHHDQPMNSSAPTHTTASEFTDLDSYCKNKRQLSSINTDLKSFNSPQLRKTLKICGFSVFITLFSHI